MKTIKSLAIILLAVFCFTSCELDNYEAPGGSIYGALIDEVTGDSVQSDIYDGARIAFVEIDTAYENPQNLYQVLKVDGSFRNNLMFEGLYAVPSIEDGNFHPTDSLSVTVDGDTEFNMEVLPYVRIIDPVLTMEGMVLTATFELEQTVDDSVSVVYAAVFAHTEPTVGKAHSLDDEDSFINAAAVADSTYTIEWDMSRSRSLKDGVPYFFRLGAIIDVPGARYNYAKAVRLTPIDE